MLAKEVRLALAERPGFDQDEVRFRRRELPLRCRSATGCEKNSEAYHADQSAHERFQAKLHVGEDCTHDEHQNTETR